MHHTDQNAGSGAGTPRGNRPTGPASTPRPHRRGLAPKYHCPPMAVAGARRRRRKEAQRVGPYAAGSPEAVRIVRGFRAVAARAEAIDPDALKPSTALGSNENAPQRSRPNSRTCSTASPMHDYPIRSSESGLDASASVISGSRTIGTATGRPTRPPTSYRRSLAATRGSSTPRSCGMRGARRVQADAGRWIVEPAAAREWGLDPI